MKRFRKGQKLWKIYGSMELPDPVRFERYDEKRKDLVYVRIGDRVYPANVVYLYRTHAEAIDALTKRLNIATPTFWKKLGWK